MKRRCWPGILLGLTLVGLPCWAQQSSPLDPPDLERYLRWGPLRARPSIQLKKFGPDSNILASPVAPEEDFVAAWAPGLDGLLLLGSRAFFEFREELKFQAYRTNTDQNFVDQRGDGRITVPIRRIGVFGDFELNNVHERPVDVEDIRPERRERALGFGLLLEPGWRTQLELRHGRKRFRYSDDDPSIALRLDRASDTTTLDVNYLLRGRTSLSLDAERGLIEFVNLDSLGRSKDSRAWSVTPGMRFGEGGRLAGAFRLGWTVVDAEEPTLPDFSGAVGRTDLVYRPSSRASLRLSGKREPGFSVYETSTYYLDTRATVRFVYYVVSFLGIESAVMRGRLTFPDDDEIDRQDDIKQYDLGLRFRLSSNSIGRKVEYGLIWTHYSAESNQPGLDRTRSTLNFTASLGF